MKTEHYQILTLVFAVLFLITIAFNIIPDGEQAKYDDLCQRAGLDYAKLDLPFAQFQCCNVFEVSDPLLNITYEGEGCSDSFDFVNGN